ncbi:Ig-like domain-containing protein [Vibrio vulnificus]|uniref:Ig-like domain-containing protein n=1 Tax=Vibrio vulnificus TaxID=672 RepID=UPI001059114E|nr:Ig-like domain-containing protein [Vibrio vulnificus]QBN13958.1 Ig-like domain-containing protein [Vibrio vulnificus]
MDFTAFLAGASLTAGRIVVLDLNGNIKILAPGQAIAPGELVIETLEETDVPQFRIATDAGETNITDDIQQIFAALEEGQDPTQLGDDFATAAGETGGSSLVAGGTISRIGAESLASTDFSTQGLQALGLNEAQSLSLFDLLNDANTALQDIDSIAPSAPTITLDTDSGSKADDFLTNDGSYTVTDIEDGATVEYFVDGEWTTTEPVAVEGENTIIIRQTDDAGNSSESSTLTFTLDTTAPDAPQISLDTDSGSLADDFLTNKGDFTVAGTEEGATVEYFVNGEWTTTAPTPVEGDNTIIVRQTDAAGNTSGSSTLTFTLDTTAPDAPQISLDIDSGSLADDFLTNKGDFTVTGTEEGATVEYFVNGEWTTTAPTPVEGDNTIIVRQTDAAGNISGSSTLTFTLDTTAPDAPQISLDIDSGSLADDFLTNKGDFTVAGTEEGATVEYFVNGEWTTTAPTPVEGENTIIVRQTDAAGNTSGSSTLTFTLDTTAPDAPQISLDIDSGSLADDFLTNKGDFAVTGTEEGATVEYFVNGEWTTTAPTPVEGDNTIIVRQTDTAGNTSGSSTLTFTLDTTAQAGTVSVDPITSDDVITETEKNQTITVTGSATGGDIKTGDIVTAIINGKEYTGSVSEDGAWELSVSGSDLAVDTAFEVTVNSTDAAGNEVTSKGESVHRFDDTPINVNIDIDPITSDSVINAQEVNSLVTVTGTVTGESFSSGVVTLTINGVEYTGEVVDGKYSIEVKGSDLSADSDNVVDAKVDVVNTAGNIGSATSTEFYLVDTFARGTIKIDPITDDNVVNKAESEGLVKVTGSVGGDARPGDQVTVVVNGVTYTTSVLSNKTWEVSVSGSDLAQDDKVTATVTGDDWAGNPFSGSGERDYVVDTTAAGAPGVTITEDGDNDGYISAAELSGDVNVTISLTGTNAVAGDTLTVNGTDIELTQAQIDAGEVLTTVAAPAEGATLTVEATITDKAGNVSEKGTDSAILDTTAAGAPGVTITEDGDNDGYISAAELSGDVNVTISLTGTNAVAGDTLTVNGTDIELTQAQIDAGEVLTTVAAPAEGATLTVEATITDKAGNVSEKGTDSAILDTTAAGAPGVTITEDGDNDGYISAAELSGDVNVTISLTGTNAVAGDTLTVNGTDIELTQAQIDAGEVLTTVAAPAEGATLTVEATITDKAGNVSEKGTDSAILDTTAAGAPGVTITEDGDNDGYISAAELSGDVNVTISLTGTNAVAGDTLTVNGTDIELTQAQIDAGEVLTTVAAPAEGATLTVEATITDKAGNVSEKGTDSAILDTTAAGAPGVTITEDGDNDGYISAAELSGDVNVTISLTGTNAVAGDTLTVNGTDIELTQAQIDAGEVLTTVAAPAEGATLTVEATITDKAGNVSEKGTDSAILDTTAAGAPGVTITEDGDNDGYISAAELSGDVNVTISLTGTNAVAGDTLTVNGTDIELTQAQIDAGEVLTTVAAPAEGATLTVEATITDKAGNVSEKGTDSAILDTTAAGAPGVTITEDGDNDGYISAAELSGDVNVTISLTGTNAVAGDTLTVNGTDIELTQAQIDAGEVLTTVAAPAEGATLTVEATITDKAGNVSEKGTDSAILDTTAAGAPGVTITEDGDNDGYISAAELSGDVNVTISLTGTNAVAGDTLTVNGTDIELTQAQIDAGEVLTTVAAPAEGATLTVEATITDKAGNVSEKGTDSAILDTTAAGAPGVTITEDGDNDGYISAAELSGDVNVTISLTGTNAVAGDTLTVNGTDIELTQAQIDAGEVLTTVAAPAEGATLTVEATITDKAGNVSEKGTDSAILDTTAAGAPGVTITEDGDNDGYISAAELSGDVNVTISLTGTNAVAGDTLTVNGTDIELTQAQIDAGEVLTTVAAPAEGATLTVEATITDKAGNVSEKGTDSAILDTTAAGAPGVTITEDGDNDGYISAAELSGDVNVTISLTGTNAVAGDTLTVNGTDIELTQAQIDAGEVLTTVAAPAEGATLTVEATITDKAGNVSEKGTDSAILDTTAAGAPGVTITEDGDNDGYISAAELSGDVNVTISLTGTNAVAGDTLTVNGTDIELTQAQIDAGEVLTTVAAPAEGATLTVEATITDKAGNVSEKGTDSAILDTTAAGAPGVTITEDGDNDGYISAAELSGDVNVTISLTGTNAVAGDTLTVNGTDIELTQAQIDAGEVLTTVAAPAEGATLTVEATITDKAGNVSEKGTDSAILDTTAAGAPGVTITEDGDNDGYISAAELSGDVNVTISLTGTNAVAGDTLTVNGTDIELTQAQIDAGEVLTTVAAPAEGATLTVEATITDKAGNVSEKGTDSAILDTTAAGAPGVTITEDGDNDGYISAAELSGDVNVTISLTGTNAVAGDTLTVNGTDIELTQAQIDAGEVLTTVAAPAEGATLTVEATITDKAGNVSEKGTDSAILDTTAAGAPGVTITEDGDNDGYISAAELSGDVNVTISLTGTNAVAGDTLTVNGTDIELTQAQIDAGEVLTTVAAPAEGATLTVEATITDKAGNVSEKGTDSAILDTTAAGAPGVTITEDGDNDGYISAAELSGDVNVTISLTGTNAVAGDTLTVNGTDIELTQAQIDAGEVLTTVAAPAEGATLTVEATITDKAGNVSEKGTDSAILDTTAAGAPGVTITEDGDNDGYISAAELSGDVNVTISLTGTNAVAGDTLTVNGTDIELTQAQIDAGEVLTTVAAPAEGATLTVEATITDKAGNVSEKGTDSAILDTTAAGAPGVTITEDGDNDGYISAAELSGDVNVTISLTGTNAVAGDTLTVNGTDIELTQAQIDAGEVLTTVAAPAEGATLTVEATITDKAGNVSEKGTDSAILDTTAAGAPGVTITEDGDNDGYISAAELSGDVNVTISLTGTNAVAGDTLTVNGTDIELTQAQIDAGEVLTTVAAPAEGATLTVEATITDKAGNVSEKGTDSAILDTTAAGAPGVTITEDGDNDGYISAAELSGDVNVTISLTGTNAVAGDTLTVNGTDIELTQAQIDAGEVLTTVAAPAEGATLTVEATITDKAGNVSEKGTDSAILDTTAAGAPGVTITEDGDNDGYISAAELSGDVNVTISLTGTNAVAGDTLTVNGTDIELTQAQIDAGEVLTTVAAPAEGATLTVEATITDKAGNVSEKGTDSAILDTTAAGAPGVTITEDGDNDGYISAAELSGDVNVTISLTGTNAVAGDTLTVNGTDIELTQAQIDAGEVLTTVAAPAEGATLTVEATITDKAGNVSEKGTDSAILDTTAAGAPGVTITEDGDNDGYISAAELSGDVNVTISLTGTNAVAGDTLTVNGTDIELTQAQIDAGEVLTTVAAPAEGATLTVEATITDKAGNVSEKGTDSAILDTTAAGAPGVTITEDGDNDGYISAAELSGDVNVTISLTGTNAVAGDTLTVNGTDIELTQAQIDAGEVLTTVAAPAEGATLTVEATITDKAGNVSEKGTDSAILDTTAAGAPGVTITEDGDNDGYISAAELSGDVNVTISLTGTNAVAGDTLTVNGTDIELTQAQIDAGEVLTTVAAPAEGATLTVEATITDKAGNVSEKGTDSAILDTTAAGAPGVTITEDGDNDGYISAAELSGDVNVTISLTGTNAVAGDTLTVNGTDIELTQAQIDAGEVLTTVAAPAEGATLTVEATITDKAGNVSEKGTDSAILDTTAAGAPGVTITEDGDNDGYISAAELSGDVNVTISLTGTNAVAGDTLTVNGTDIELTQAQIDAGEVLTTVAAPAEGATLTVEATITDKAGNVSEKGTDSAILDTTAAGAPGVTITEDGDNDGYISAAELSGDVNVTISLTGTNAVAGDTLTVNGTDIELTQAQIDAGEVLTTVAAPAEGATLTVEATITDKAGNVSEKGTDSAILDTTAAGAPGVTITEDGDNDGYISAAELSGDVNVTISLTGTNAVAGDTLTVNGTDIELTQAQIDAGEVLTTVAAPAEGATLTVEATITDKAGNVSEKGTDSAILDTTAAGAPGVTITEDGDNDGYISAAELSGDVNVTISLTGTNAVAGDTLTVNGTDIELTQAQIDAGEVLTTVAAPAEGATLTVEATITDKAGNVSEKGTDSAILDTTAAGAPGVTITEDGDNDGYISAAELSGDVNVTISLTGTNAVAGDTLTVNGTDIELTQAQIDAGEVLTTVAAPAEGATLTVEATITDKAGNVSEKGTDSAILDTTAAGAPGVTITEDGDNDGYISAAELSGDVNVTISLTGTNAVAGDTLTVNGTDIELTQAQIDAGEVLTTVAAPAEGATLTVEATITDKAGNVSEKGTDSAILDTTAAGAPGVTITEDGDNDGYISAAELSGDVNVTISLTGTMR